MEFDLAGKRTIVERSGKPKTLTNIKCDDFERWNLRRDIKNGYWSTSSKTWTEILGNLVFDLPVGKELQNLGSYKPTFRSVYSYLARENPSGFQTYERHFAIGGKYQYQVPLSFILGIDWKISQQLEQLRRTDKRLNESKKASESEDFLPDIGSPAELRTPIVTKERRYRELEQNLKQFSLLPEYRQYEDEAISITNQMNDLTDQILLDESIIADLQSSMDSEQAPEFGRLEELYEEAKVILPKSVTLRYKDVKQFHSQIIENRRLYLQGEIELAKDRIRKNRNLREELESRNSKILAILRPHGPIDQLVALEGELRDLAGELAILRQRLEDARAYERRKTELQLLRTQLELQLQENLSEQIHETDSAIIAFEEVASHLYVSGGALLVRPTHDGPEFEVTMSGERSKGITNMRTFAFDMMLMIVCARRSISPGFLIHDSHLFDGVDSRQINKALQVGAPPFGGRVWISIHRDHEL